MVNGITVHDTVVLHTGGVRTPAEVFTEIYLVFLALGTLVGVVVISYTLYNAIKYRRGTGDRPTAEVSKPTLGELPTGSGGGRKLFVSFGISAVIVLSLIAWTYSSLLYVDAGPDEDESLEVDVIGRQFQWQFVYPNGFQSSTLRVPDGQPVRLNVTSADVMHNIGIPEFHTKIDAIPGQTTTTWFVPNGTGTYEAVCYELCGIGHSNMRSDVVVMEPEQYQRWYNQTTSGTDAGVGGGDDR